MLSPQIIEMEEVAKTNRTFVYVEGLNLQFQDLQILWWRNGKPIDKEDTIIMSDVHVETSLFDGTWGADNPDIVIAVRYNVRDGNTKEMQMREQKVRTQNLRMYDVIIDGPHPCPEVSTSRN